MWYDVDKRIRKQKNNMNNFPETAISREKGPELYQAESILTKLSEVAGNDPVETDKIVSEFVHDMQDAAESEIVAAETGMLEVLRDENATKTEGELNALSLESLGAAMKALESGKGEDAAKIIIDRLDVAHHKHEYSTAEQTLEEARRQHGLSGESELVSMNEINRRENDAKLNDYLDKSFFLAGEIGDYADLIPDISGDVRERIVDVVVRAVSEAQANPDTLMNVVARFPDLITNEKVLGVLPHAEEIAKLFSRKPEAVSAMLHSNTLKGRVVKNVFNIYCEEADESRRQRIVHYSEVLADETSTKTAKQIAISILRLGRLSEIGEIGYGDVAHGATQTYLPEQNILNGVPVPTASRLPNRVRALDDIPEQPLESMSEEQKLLCLKEDYVSRNIDMQSGEIRTETASLADLKGEYQELVLAERVQRAYEKSNSVADIISATARNIELVESGEHILSAGNLVHTGYIKDIDNFLENGLVCGEFVGDTPSADAFPFNVDFYKLTETAANAEKPINSISSRIEHDGTITFVVDRSEESRRLYPDRLADVVGSNELDNQHRLVLGAVPSTEIKAVVAHSNEVRADLEAAIVRHGMYLPILDERGEVVFSPQDFKRLHDRVVVGKIDSKQMQATEDVVRKERVAPWDRVKRESTGLDGFGAFGF